MSDTDTPPPTSPQDPTRMNRRDAMRWIAAATASFPFLSQDGLAAQTGPAPGAKGYGLDPVMNKVYAPGELWPLILTDTQRRSVIVLCDIIIPADATSPSASEVKVQDFIDEWVSSPYKDQNSDRNLILRGLGWLDEEAKKRGAADFVSLDAAVQLEMCQDLARQAMADSKAYPGSFFKRMRDLISGGYYTTPEGMKAIGYTGNIPQGTMPSPSQEALAHLGLE